jgi:hypothetical protein
MCAIIPVTGVLLDLALEKSTLALNGTVAVLNWKLRTCCCSGTNAASSANNSPGPTNDPIVGALSLIGI